MYLFYYKSHCSVTFTRFYSKHLLLSARHFRNATFITRDVTETLKNSTKRTRRYALMEQNNYSPALKSTHQKQFFSSMLQKLCMTMKIKNKLIKQLTKSNTIHYGISIFQPKPYLVLSIRSHFSQDYLFGRIINNEGGHTEHTTGMSYNQT